MREFWLYSAFVLLMISKHGETSILMKGALFLTAIMLTINLSKDIKEYCNGRKEKKNHNLKRG